MSKWKALIRGAGLDQTVTGFSSRAAAAAWLERNHVPGDGYTTEVVEYEGMADVRRAAESLGAIKNAWAKHFGPNN